jgi:hypothetical protein
VDVPQVPDSLANLLAARFPWMKFLTKDANHEFVHEFIDTMRACASVGNSAALDEVVQSWKSTAAIYSDPKLAADLKRSLPGTHTKVSRP